MAAAGERSGDRVRTATGVAIASYTLWDKHAVGPVALSPIVYLWGSNVGIGLLLTPWVLRNPGTGFHRAWVTSRRRAAGVGLLSQLAYVLILYALTHAPVSSVAPARESSILIGTLLGAVVLGEGDTRRRVIAASGDADRHHRARPRLSGLSGAPRTRSRFLAFERLDERPRGLASPSIEDQLCELLDLDQRQSHEDRGKPIVVRLGEELVLGGGEQGLLVEAIDDAHRHHVGPWDLRLLRLDALVPSPHEALLPAFAGDGKGEAVVRLDRLGQGQRDAADVGLVSHGGAASSGRPCTHSVIGADRGRRAALRGALALLNPDARARHMGGEPNSDGPASGSDASSVPVSSVDSPP